MENDYEPDLTGLAPFEGYGGGLLRFVTVAQRLAPDECMRIGPTGLWEPEKVDDFLRRMLTGTEGPNK